ncbi:hypothetical protein QYE76_030198 [Lolium multiflorum]|uniref:Gag-pol polyprotein n=1 Tax=Lolium multiflorum TaxID=4521 RepID=A0AAD8QP98_LOLMU|nr:hypothetical protein QYE76_030198 [Lolium multiflorum]
MDACAYLEEPIIMTFGEFRFGVNKEGSYRLEVPISSEFSAVDSNFSSSDEEFSSPYFVDNKASGKLAKIFSNTSFESSADSFISSDSDSVDSFNFIDKSVAIGKVFTTLYDGVTNLDKNQCAKYHQIYVVEGAGTSDPQTSEAFDELGNPYVDPADLRHGLGTKYPGSSTRARVQLPQEAWDRAAKAMDGSEPMTTTATAQELQAYQYRLARKARPSNRAQKVISRQVFMAEKMPPPTVEYLNWSGQDIGFTIADHPQQVPRPGQSALILPAVIAGFDVSRVFIDGGSSLNLMYADTLRKMNISLANLKPTDTRFHGITPEKPSYPLGKINLDVQFGTRENYRIENLEFEVVDFRRNITPCWDDQRMPDMASSINFNQFLEKEKLKSNGSNFTDWFRHVRIFLNGGNLQYVLDAPLGDPPAETETDEVKNVYMTRKTRYSQVQCAILCSLESDLQKRFEHHDPHELIKELKTIFETHAAVECYEASKHFFSCMMEEGSSISEHMLVMTGHAKKLSDLGIVIPNRLGINRVLQSLPPSYKNFVMNYNMQNMNKEFPELFGMLKAAEIEIKKEHQVLMVNKTTSFKKQGKSKGKNKKSGKKAATPPVKPKSGPKPDAECYYCKEKGHWKRNCSKYLADLKSGLIKKKKEGISDIHVIDVYLTSSRSSTWVFDTGSVAHICNSKQELKNKRQLLKDEVTMRVGNGSKVNVIAVGTLPLHLPSGLVLSLNNCYYVPALSMNIISGSCLMQDGYSFKSENNGCSIFMNNIFYGRAPQKNGLFLLDLDSSNTHIHNIDAKRIKLNDNSTYMWHCRLGHIGVKRMKKLHTDGLLESLDFESLDRCEACLMGKMTKTPFSGMMERATDLLEIIHTDVCGPMSVASRGGYRYVLTFTDDLSRYGYIYLMKHKSETFEKFKEFQSEVENQRNKKIKFLRSDRGGEYLSYEFSMHLKKCGILSQLTPPGTPQRNGVSERRNRTLLDMVRSMMSLTDLPLSFWSYALETAAFTLNRAPSKSVETTPYELWFNKKPKLSFLKVWGCEAYVKKLQPDKLEPKAEKCVFIGYPKETIGYTFYHRSEGKIFVAKNGTFLEKEFLTKEVTGRKVELDEIEESLLVDQSSAVPENVPVPPTPTTEEANDNDHETSNETATEPRRSTRDRATPDWYDPCLNVMIVDNNDEDPATYEEAMMSPDSNKWQEAMKSEMGSMYDNKVWTLVELPDSRKAVENKWIFKRKTDADGNITVYKARLVAKGFRQIQGVDYDETFSPVAKLKSVRILLAIAAFFDYEIWQMDVKTAFLNGDIEEELYMVQPKGFVDPKNADKVCKLQRSIYGLKQASRSWNRRFDKVIKDFGFIQCHGEACIYKKVSGSSVAFLILYVDDILLIGNDIELLSSVKGYLNNSFSMKDLGEASYILGIKIYRDRSRRLIGLSQSTYLDKILKKFRMDESKKGFLPMLPGKVLSKTQGPATAEERERMSQIPYASAVGSIMYAMLCTRPDIAHAVSLTSRYQSDPGMEHWTAVKNILKYLKRTKDMFLCYGGDQELVVTSYTDASWNTDPDDSKSQSGYVFILNGAAVSWASSKQCTVAKSSTESEYIAASEASSEAVWMKRFIVELGVVPSALDPFVIYCDNMGAIANAQEPRSHKRLKHIKLRYHSIREYIEDGEVKICKVHTDLNVADPLTKALPRAKHDQHQNAMGVRSFTFRRRRSASAAAAMPRRGSSYRYGGVSSSGYRSVRARPKLRYFLLGTAPTIGSAGLGAFTPSLFHAQVFEMFLALFNTGSNLST